MSEAIAEGPPLTCSIEHLVAVRIEGPSRDVEEFGRRLREEGWRLVGGVSGSRNGEAFTVEYLGRSSGSISIAAISATIAGLIAPEMPRVVAKESILRRPFSILRRLWHPSGDHHARA